jgi:Ferritin-like
MKHRKGKGPERSLPDRAGSSAAARALSRLEDDALTKPEGMPWRDYLIMLLHAAAELEHGLMVQYLYAAYSLGDEAVPAKLQPKIRRWRDHILTVAKEEMGHLLTVQNVLCFLGGPVSVHRRQFPWQSPFTPFPFSLEPLSLKSLSYYVFAEMPDDLEGLEDRRKNSRAWRFLTADEEKIRASVLDKVGKVTHGVGRLYLKIIEIMENVDHISDSDLRPDSFSVQASWDDWGRGYRPAPARPGKTERPEGQSKSSVIILQMGTRTEAVDALKQVASQGEAAHVQSNLRDEPSHFDRFVEIYQQFDSEPNKAMVRPVPVNPCTDRSRESKDTTLITNEFSSFWARLFNVRYRMLLTYLTHAFHLARAEDGAHSPLRGAIMHRVFGEMYNLKAIAGILVRSPLTDPGDERRAGPPFEVPYDLTLPADEIDRWRLHRDLVQTSLNLGGSLAEMSGADEAKMSNANQYLKLIAEIDREARAWIDQVIEARSKGKARS